MPTQGNAKGFTLNQQLNVKFDKVKWPNFVNSPNYIARKNSISFPPIGTNIKSEKAGELPVVLGNLARQELLLWIEKIRLSHCRKIQQQETQMVIQTDTFTKGWGAHCNGISTGGNGWKKNRDTIVMFCSIWYHSCNLIKVKNTHGWLSFLVTMQAFSLQLVNLQKVALLHGFPHF